MEAHSVLPSTGLQAPAGSQPLLSRVPGIGLQTWVLILPVKDIFLSIVVVVNKYIKWNDCCLGTSLRQRNIKQTAAAAKSLQSCLTLCDPRDGSPPGSAVPGILQAGTLEWVAISFSNSLK